MNPMDTKEKEKAKVAQEPKICRKAKGKARAKAITDITDITDITIVIATTLIGEVPIQDTDLTVDHIEVIVHPRG